MNAWARKAICMVLVGLIFLTTSLSIFAAEVKKPTITAAGAIVYCENTGEIVYSKNMNQKLSPYSITKLMTVLLAVQNLPMDKEITISEEAASQKEASMNLKAGEVVTVKDLLYGAMLPSGNDAAYALGEAVSGSMSKFIKLMNKTASNIGCKNTNFVNANGMKAKKHYTTAYDMMQITKVALSNETIRKISGTKKYVVEETNKSKRRVLKSHLPSLSDENSGIYAGKTGYWDASDSSIALGYEKDGLSLYVVIIGAVAKERSKDVDAVIQYAKDKIEGIPVIKKDAKVGKIRIKHGAKTRLQTYVAEAGYAYLPKEASKNLIATKTVYESDITAPVKAGTVVGTYQIYASDELVNEIDLIIKEDVDEGWFPSYLGISNLNTMIICGVILVLLVLFIWISAARAANRRKKRLLRKQKAMEIAMEQMKREREHKERDWHF
ncbi:D-alanyl-D-alanine carboxypeptidase (penicillin-binding protein 5/6) [Clostridiales Family XIII bacterium PM5-7]